KENILVLHRITRLFILHMLHSVHGTRAFRFDGSYQRGAYCTHHCSVATLLARGDYGLLLKPEPKE
ncbi:MAG TPA: hypothetical protein VF343_08130, partial [Syntrophales bacterium]